MWFASQKIISKHFVCNKYCIWCIRHRGRVGIKSFIINRGLCGYLYGIESVSPKSVSPFCIWLTLFDQDWPLPYYINNHRYKWKPPKWIRGFLRAKWCGERGIRTPVPINRKPHFECGDIKYLVLLQQHHLLGLHKLTSTNLVEVDTCTYWLTKAVCGIPLYWSVACFLGGVYQLGY